MYTKVYGCACWWSSCVSVYFFIRCWAMWLYIFWYDCAKGFSMYVFARIVNHFIVSRTYSVRFWLHFSLDGYRLRAYILYVTGVIWNELLRPSRRSSFRALVSCSMADMAGRLCSCLALAWWARLRLCWQRATCYLFATKEVSCRGKLNKRFTIAWEQSCGRLCWLCFSHGNTIYKTLHIVCAFAFDWHFHRGERVHDTICRDRMAETT